MSKAPPEETPSREALRRQIDDLESQLRQLRFHLHQREQELAQVLYSRSWAVTRPLRWLGDQVRRRPWLLGPVQRALAWWRTRRVSPAATFISAAAAADAAPALPDPQAMAQTGIELRDAQYADWIRRYDTLTPDLRAALRAHLPRLAGAPRISVVMPTHDPEPAWLQKAIDSVRAQIYPNWELCIADDCSTDPRIAPLLAAAAQADARIRLVRREVNGHISAASNSALALATGEFVALLDHDDLLAEHALFWVADAVLRHPDVQLLYSDEDKIDDDDRRHDAYFKCDWNPDLMLSQNMFSHLGVYRRSLLQRVGGFREGFEGSQDYDLALRCLEQVRDDQVHHIPRVLYHWRVHARSTARSVDSKPYATTAAVRALQEHHARGGAPAQVQAIACGYRTRYPLPEPRPSVSVIVPTRNALHLLRRCAQGVLRDTRYAPLELIIVDNGSDDPATLAYLAELARDERVRVLRDERPFNFSALNNAAVAQAGGEFVALLNNDIEVVEGDWLAEMVSHAVRPGIGAVGAKLLYPDNRVQHAGVVLGLGAVQRGVAGHPHNKVEDANFGYFGRAALVQNFSAVTAACLVVRRSSYEAVGGFDESIAVAFNDVDFCLRLLQAGYRNLYTPFARLYHHESATRGYENTPEKVARFTAEVNTMLERWGDLLRRDPAYSPNLTLHTDDFALAFPPRVGPRPEPLPA